MVCYFQRRIQALSITHMIIPVNDTITLELLNEKHGPEVFDLINQNRSYLRKCLPWVDKMRSYQQFQLFIKDSYRRAIEGNELSCVTFYNGEAAGRAGIYNIDRKLNMASIGYWLSEPLQGRGIITECCRALISYAFKEIKLEKIEIRCAPNNLKSQAIAERLNFKKCGLIKQGEFLNRRFIDLNVFCLLKTDWLKADKINSPAYTPIVL